MRLPRELDPVEIRILGALLEKEQSTPDYYPLTLNALVAACGQKSNRHPVMHLAADDVIAALDRLHEEVMVWPVQGARSDRWRHSLDRRWELEDASKAIITLLLLRGPQTPGELRGRSERLHPFRSTHEVEAALLELSQGDEPLVVCLQRRPGQKEARWAHLAGGAPSDEVLPDSASESASGLSLSARVTDLEARIARLEALVTGDATQSTAGG
jgi:uncharacterized protein YceH (UPF0502 family)